MIAFCRPARGPTSPVVTLVVVLSGGPAACAPMLGNSNSPTKKENFSQCVGH